MIFNSGVISRSVAAIVVGYLFSAVACLWLNLLLGLADRDARLMTNMTFFIFYTVIAIWVFTPKSHSTAVVSTAVTTMSLWAMWWFVQGVVA